MRFHDIDFECVDAGFGCNTPVDVVVRPEDIDIMPLGKTALKGTIKSVLFMGVHYEFRIETAASHGLYTPPTTLRRILK